LILEPSISRRSPFASGFFLGKARRPGFIHGARINQVGVMFSGNVGM
jgi:hypothetical protein